MINLSWKGIIIIAIILLPNLTYAILPKQNMPAIIENGGTIVNIMEHGGS